MTGLPDGDSGIDRVAPRRNWKKKKDLTRRGFLDPEERTDNAGERKKFGMSKKKENRKNGGLNS